LLIGRRDIAIPTQNIDPIKVWELEAGSPRYQVPAFHKIAVMRRERTTHIPKALHCFAIISRGRRWIIPIATVIPQSVTQTKFITAASITALLGLRECEYITGETALAVSW
jgi:hypothetical protein